MNKNVARSLFTINEKGIKIEDVHSIISQNKKLLLRNLGNYSATLHDVNTLKDQQNKSNLIKEEEEEINQDVDLMGGEVTNPANNANDFDLFDIDIPTSNPVETPVANNDDLFGLDLNVQPQPAQPESKPETKM